MRPSPTALPLALTVLLAACESAGLGPQDYELPPGTPSPVTTDSDSYTLIRNGEALNGQATVRYTNPTKNSVYFARCFPDDQIPLYQLIRVGPDSTVGVALGEIWSCVGGVAPGVILPGRSVTFSVGLDSYDQPAADPPITLAERTGTFRIHLALCTSAHTGPDECEPIPLAARSSDPFEVLAPPP